MRKIAAAFLLLGLISLPKPAHAVWPDTGLVIINPLPSRGARAVYLKPSANGDFFPLIHARSNVAGGFTAHRILPDGEIAAGWGLDGVFLAQATAANSYHTNALAADADGGVFHVGFFDQTNPDSVGLQYAQPPGVLDPYPFGTSNFWHIARAQGVSTQVDAVLDGAGGAYIAWTWPAVRLQRRQSDGSLEPGWSTFGRFIGSVGTFPGIDIESDGEGGAIVFWTSDGGPPRAIRILPDTTTAPGWNAAGLVLGANASAIGSSFADLPKLIPSGPDHWIAVWVEPPFTTPIRVVAQRFANDGTLDPAWPAAGLVIVPSAAGIGEPTVISDGVDGIHVLWTSNSAPRWTHVLASGAFAPGHGSAGISPLDASADYEGSAAYMVATHAPDRGLIFLWWDLRDSTSTIRARWLLSDGTSDPSEPDEGRLIDDPFAFGVMAAMSDGAGGVYVVWQKSYDEFTHRLYMSRLAHGTPLAVPEPLSGDGLALRVPNPARGALDVRYRLPDAAPARLELFDVSGRRLRALDVRGIGEGTARFERLAELRAGVYVIRLSQGREQRTARVAFLP